LTIFAYRFGCDCAPFTVSLVKQSAAQNSAQLLTKKSVLPIVRIGSPITFRPGETIMTILACGMCGGVVEMALTGAVLTITATVPIVSDYLRLHRKAHKLAPAPATRRPAPATRAQAQEQLAELTSD
jgi:hypothetical protein